MAAPLLPGAGRPLDPAAGQLGSLESEILSAPGSIEAFGPDYAAELDPSAHRSREVESETPRLERTTAWSRS